MNEMLMGICLVVTGDEVRNSREARVMQEVCDRFHQLQVDHTEYACLKAIILFKPGMCSDCL